MTENNVALKHHFSQVKKFFVFFKESLTDSETCFKPVCMLALGHSTFCSFLHILYFSTSVHLSAALLLFPHTFSPMLTPDYVCGVRLF